MNRSKSTLQQVRKKGKDKRVEDFLLLGGDLVVLFYGEWCTFSQETAPVFAEVASSLQLHVSPRFAKVNVDHAPNLCIKFSISELPTILFVRGDRFLKLDPHKRSFEHMQDFALGEYSDSRSDWESKLSQEAFEAEYARLNSLAQEEAAEMKE
jgi:thiol-disulfide isomerase/thioredoxin